MLYSSTDLDQFTFEQLYTTKQLSDICGECPDIFALDGHRILAVCPRGVPSEAEQYQNIYQSGVFYQKQKRPGLWTRHLREPQRPGLWMRHLRE